MIRAVVLAAVCVVGVASVAVAGGAPTFMSLVQDAQRAWTQKDAAAATHKLEAALRVARNAAPLDVRKAVVINHDHTGIGMYTPATGDVVDGRHLRIYVEVANMVGVVDGDHTRVTLDVQGAFRFEDKGPDGKPDVLSIGTRSFGTQSYATYTDLGVTSFGIDAMLADTSPPGVYGVTLSVTDKNGNKSAQRDVRFVLR